MRREALSQLRKTFRTFIVETIHTAGDPIEGIGRPQRSPTLMTSPTATTRVCFQLQVRPELLDEYIARHTPVWPEMLEEIAAAGRRNYSLFLGDGGRLIGYYETDDDEAAQAYLAQSEVAARWEAEMGRFFTGLDGRPDQAATALTEVFNLHDQLTAARGAASEKLQTDPAHEEGTAS
jgi:L-rhamnose mutarotase